LLEFPIAVEPAARLIQMHGHIDAAEDLPFIAHPGIDFRRIPHI
jgi:hypothetical protein